MMRSGEGIVGRARATARLAGGAGPGASPSTDAAFESDSSSLVSVPVRTDPHFTRAISRFEKGAELRSICAANSSAISTAKSSMTTDAMTGEPCRSMPTINPTNAPIDVPTFPSAKSSAAEDSSNSTTSDLMSSRPRSCAHSMVAICVGQIRHVPMGSERARSARCTKESKLRKASMHLPAHDRHSPWLSL